MPTFYQRHIARLSEGRAALTDLRADPGNDLDEVVGDGTATKRGDNVQDVVVTPAAVADAEGSEPNKTAAKPAKSAAKPRRKKA